MSLKRPWSKGLAHYARVVLFLGMFLLLNACAHVGFEPGVTRLQGKTLVFGRIVLERDGETAVISTMSTPVVLRNLANADEPGLVLQAFDGDGRFFWALQPGHYELNLILSRYDSERVSYAFSVPRSGTAAYFGDLIVAGTKRFDTIGGANIREVRPRLEDHFETAWRRLLERNPQLDGIEVDPLELADMKISTQRWRAYRAVLAGQAPSCPLLSCTHTQDLAPGARAHADMGETSPVFHFSSGLSRYVRWRLPTGDRPYVIDILSEVTPGNMPGLRRTFAFAPAVLLLDENHVPMEFIEQGLFTVRSPGVLPPRAARLEARLPMEGDRLKARSLVLLTTPRILAATMSTWAPQITPMAGGAIPTMGVVSMSIEPSISGRVEVSLPYGGSTP